MFFSLQNSMTRVIPRGFTPLESTRDGNCLYSSASLALLGSSDASNLLRFSSVCCAVKNFTKYLNWVNKKTHCIDCFLN